MRCVLVGNYGVGNIGDEALLEYFLHAFPEVEWTVVSGGAARGDEKHMLVPRLPFGFRSLFSPWWNTIRAIARADAMVFGGGSLFTDVESVRACMIWNLYVAVARLFGTPFVLAFQGAGPWRSQLARRVADKAYATAIGVSVRDEGSLARVSTLPLRHPPVLTFDPAFSFFSSRKHEYMQAPGKHLVLIPRHNSGADFLNKVRELMLSPWDGVTIVLMEPDAEQGIRDALKTILPFADIAEIRTVDALLHAVGKGTLVFSQRFHGALAALALERPFEVLPQHAGDKMDALRHALSDASSVRSACLSKVTRGEEHLRSVLAIIAS